MLLSVRHKDASPPRRVNDRLELSEGRAGASREPAFVSHLKDFSFYPKTNGQPLEGFKLSVTGLDLFGRVTRL